MVNKVKLQYNTYITVAGSGQVDSGVSDNFESEVIYLVLVNFQQSVCCEVHFGPTEKDLCFRFVGHYYCVSIITIIILIELLL